jgi:type II secretory pathway component PulJ
MNSSLIELVISLSLSGLVLAGGLSALSSATTSSVRYQDTARHLQGLSTIDSLRALIEDDLDSHRLPQRARTHSGNVTFTDGSVNLPLVDESQALTTIRLDTNCIYQLQEITLLGPRTFTTVACPLTARDDGLPSSWAALSEEDVYELVLTNHIAWHNRCRLFTFTSTKSMMFTSLLPSPLSLSHAIGIDRLGTYHWDTRRQLRYVAHEGSMNIENQPLTPPLTRLSWKLRASSGEFPEVSVIPLLDNKELAPQVTASRLSTLPPWTLIATLLQAPE